MQNDECKMTEAGATARYCREEAQEGGRGVAEETDDR